MKNILLMVLLVLFNTALAQNITNTLGIDSGNEKYNITDSADKLLIMVQGDGNIGIGETSPKEVLHITGKIKVEDGSQGADKVLTSDVSGVGSWQVNTAGPIGVKGEKGDKGEFSFGTSVNWTIGSNSSTKDGLLVLFGKTISGGGGGTIMVHNSTLGNVAYYSTIKVYDDISLTIPIIKNKTYTISRSGNWNTSTFKLIFLPIN